MTTDLYHTLLSPPSRAVTVVAKYLGVDLNIKEMDLMKGEQMSEDFIKLNPTHKVPVLVEGDYVLWESRAIMRYLCNKYGPESSLYPSDPQKRGSVDKMLDFDSSLSHYIHDIIASQFQGTEPSEKQWDDYRKIIKQLDGMVSDRKYVAGNEMTIADISVAHTTSMLGFNDFKDKDLYPNLMVWYNGFKEESNYFRESCELAKVAFDQMMADKQK